MTIADIKTEFGNYYINQGQNAARLIQLLYRPSVTEQLFRSVVTDDTVWRMAKTAFTRLLQPFQSKWTPTGSLTATPISIQQFPMKVDIEETPDTLEATWLGFLADSSLDRKTWPFVRWLIEAHLIPQILEEYELNEIYLGVRVEPTVGTPGAAGTAMDGIRKKINDFVAAGRTTPISLGAVPTDPVAFVNYVESFCDAFSKRYYNVPMYVNVNETLSQRYARGKQAKYGKDFNMAARMPGTPDVADFLGTANTVEFTKHKLVGLPSMGSSMKVWATPLDNTVKLAKKSQNMGQFQLENVDRQVKLYTDFYKGIGFYLPEAIFTNDQDLV